MCGHLVFKYCITSAHHGSLSELESSCPFTRIYGELVSKKQERVWFHRSEVVSRTVYSLVQSSSVQFSVHPNCSKIQQFKQTRDFTLFWSVLFRDSTYYSTPWCTICVLCIIVRTILTYYCRVRHLLRYAARTVLCIQIIAAVPLVSLWFLRDNHH